MCFAGLVAFSVAQTRSHPELGRQTLQRQWYYVLRPGRVGRRQACKHMNHFPLSTMSRMANSEWRIWNSIRCSLFAFCFDAGWSSPVARQAHNLKVTGSNPVPATKSKKPRVFHAGFFICGRFPSRRMRAGVLRDGFDHLRGHRRGYCVAIVFTTTSFAPGCSSPCPHPLQDAPADRRRRE